MKPFNWTQIIIAWNHFTKWNLITKTISWLIQINWIGGDVSSRCTLFCWFWPRSSFYVESWQAFVTRVLVRYHFEQPLISFIDFLFRSLNFELRVASVGHVEVNERSFNVVEVAPRFLAAVALVPVFGIFCGWLEPSTFFVKITGTFSGLVAHKF